MSKIMLIPSNLKQLEENINEADAFLIGVDNLCVNLPVSFSIDTINEISVLISKHKKELFIVLNKNIHNNELPLLEKTMLKLNEMNIKGVLYYDIALVTFKDKLKLNYDLVWAQEHLTTNYSTINYWHSHNVDYTLISSEITLDEIMEIKENTKVKLIVPIFGHLPMFTSVRPVISNYLEYFDLKDNSKMNYIYKEGHHYPIIQNSNGTTIYSAYFLNGIEESLLLKNKGIDYLLINTLNVEDDKIKSIILSFKNVNEENRDEIKNGLNQLFNSRYDKGFLYKETVYKVKNNE